jgi:hypothetical protein
MLSVKYTRIETIIWAICWLTLLTAIGAAAGCRSAGVDYTASVAVEHREAGGHYTARISVSDSLSLAN